MTNPRKELTEEEIKKLKNERLFHYHEIRRIDALLYPAPSNPNGYHCINCGKVVRNIERNDTPRCILCHREYQQTPEFREKMSKQVRGIL